MAYNNRCLTRGVVGKDLADALRDCDEALKLQPGNIDARDTRGFVYLKLGDFRSRSTTTAASLQVDPNHARALYGRGLAKVKSGDKAAGDTDIANATRLNANIAQEFAKLGVK